MNDAHSLMQSDCLDITTQSPCAVGGLGGSGTRLVASLLLKQGYDMGAPLNASLDHLWFTALLRQPQWFKAFPPYDTVCAYARLFIEATTVGLKNRITPTRLALVEAAEQQYANLAENRRPLTPSLWAELRQSGPRAAAYGGRWGWKAPNTHIFLRELADCLPMLRYIHVLRHPLDMAFSRNRNQLQFWGGHVLGDQLDRDEPGPVQQLRFWLHGNTRAIRIGRGRLGERFHVLNYDRLCTDPNQELPALLDFLEIKAGRDTLLDLIVPQSINRYKKHDLSQFPGDLIDDAEQFFNAPMSSGIE